VSQPCLTRRQGLLGRYGNLAAGASRTDRLTGFADTTAQDLLLIVE
jgi:hypothetical protein